MTEVIVKYSLMQEFRDLAVSEGCGVVKVIEQISRQLITYILEVPDGKEELISDMAFMTFIRNPRFQKYYDLNEDVQKRIAQDDDFHKWRMSDRKPVIETESLDDQVLVRLIMDGIYPFRNKETGKFEYLKNEHGFYFGTSKKENFNQYWTREIHFLGEGQLSLEQMNSLAIIDKFRAIEKIKNIA